MSILHRHEAPRVTSMPPVGEGSDSGSGSLPPRNDRDHDNPWWKKGPAKVGAAVVATAVLVGGGMKMLDNGESQTPQRSETTTSAPATVPTTEAPSASVTPTEVTPSTPETPVTRYTPENPDQIAAFDKLVTEPGGPIKFEKYPLEARGSWVLSKLNRLAQGDNPQVVYDTRTDDLTPMTFGGKNLAEYNPVASEVDGTGGFQYTRMSAPRDVFAFGLLMQNMVGGFAELDADGRPAKFNQNLSRMLVSGRVADPASAEYKDRVDSVMHSTQLSVMYQNTLDGYTVRDGSPVHPVEVDGTTYDGMTIEYETEQGISQVEKVFIPMEAELGVDKNGQPCGIWVDKETLNNPAK